MRRLFSKLKKTVSICVACAVCVLSLTAVPMMKASAVNTAQMYKVYNAQTGSYISSYTLLANPVKDNSKSVIGTDSRVVDFSKSGVVKLMDATNYIGTGFIVDSHTIATAAHCAYNKNITGIRVFNSNGTIALTATPVQSHIPNTYIQSFIYIDIRRQYDYALITVEEDLSDYACFNLGVAMDGFLTSSKSVSITGFPTEVNGETVNNKTKNNMYTGTGIIAGGSEYTFDYNVDTIGGNSGGPIYMTTTYNGNVYYTVVGIHTRGKGYLSDPYNHGTRITTDLMHFYLNNSNISY